MRLALLSVLCLMIAVLLAWFMLERMAGGPTEAPAIVSPSGPMPAQPARPALPGAPAAPTRPGDGSPPAVPIAPNKPPASGVAASPVTTGTLELLRIGEGINRIGARFWIVDVRNGSPTEIERPSIIVSGFGADGARVEEQPGYARVQRLAPGAETTIMALIAHPSDAATRYEVTSGDLRPARYTPVDHPLPVSDIREEMTSGSIGRLTGTVRNDGGAASYIRVIAVGRAANGDPVSFAHGMPSHHELPAGGESGFRLSTGSFEIARPERWEVFAYARR